MKLRLSKVLAVVLVFSFLASCPGINESIAIYAQEATSTAAQDPAAGQRNTDAANPFSVDAQVEIDQSSVDQEKAETEAVSQAREAVSEPEKKEMGRIEKLAWTIGKALLPTIAVMAFGAAVVCPLAWVVVGSVFIGAATAGITSFAYERRMNQFREEGKKKTSDKVWRDVTIAAAVEGALAPFSLLSAGFVKAIGPTTVKSVLSAAAKVGATQFIGGTISNVARGAVTNLWYDHYYNYDDEEKELKEELKKLNQRNNLSEEDKLRVSEILKRLDKLEGERYTLKNFIDAERKTAVTAAISGVLGGGATQIAGNTKWAKIASDKLFHSPKQSGLVARAVVSNPFAFISGSANAVLQKREIDTEISRCRRLQKQYPESSPAHAYYEDKIAGLESAKEKIDLIKSGTDSMVKNLAVQSAGLTVAVAKARLWDLPRARREVVDQKVREKIPEWQRAKQIKAKIDARKSTPPKRSDFRSRSEYFKAIWSHRKEINNLEDQYRAAKVVAVAAEETPEGQALRSGIEAEVNADIALRRRLDLAKSIGDEAYIEFKAKEIKKRLAAEGKTLSDGEIRRQAIDELRSEYGKAAAKDAEELAKMEERLTLRKDIKELKGKMVTDKNGKKYVVLVDEQGNERYRRPLEQAKTTWLDKFFKKDPATREQGQITAAHRMANASGAMVKPSKYRSVYVDMKVNELKAQGYTNAQINSRMPQIVSEADRSMVGTFGGSWQSAARSEMLAAGLSRAKYNNGEPPDFETIFDTFESTAQAKIVAEFQKELNNRAKEYALNPLKQKLTGGKSDSFTQKYVNEILDRTFKETVEKTTREKVNDAYEGVDGTVKEVVTEVTHDYDGDETDPDGENQE
ncbi:MAG: hypothetical protein ACQETH_02015 [Candidatus Rifleibacteriota bacterium]